MEEEKTTANPMGSSTAPIYGQSQDKNAKWLWLLIILIIIGALVFAFVRGIGPFAKISPFNKGEIASPTPQVFASPIISSSPSASPTSEQDRAKPAVRVLNGTTTTGLAASVKDMLEGLGWRVTNIGNADTSDYEQTEVIFKEDFENYKDTLVSDLSDKYSVKVSSDILSSTDSADIEVIVGSK